MIDRRQFIKLGASAVLLARAGVSFAQGEKMSTRVSSIISGYSAQGFHRTGTDIDEQSATWLAGKIKAMGVEPEMDSFRFKRLEILEARFDVAGRNLAAVPLYDCTYTDASGISGTVGRLGSGADIGVAMAAPIGGEALEAIEAARHVHAHKAIVVVTDSRMPADGIATINAESFTAPFGPPVLQVANRHWADIQQAMKAGAKGTVIAHCKYVESTARNVQATIKGSNAALAPLVVMTPRSGWWRCASERGGGIAALLEMMRAIKAAGARRDVIFTANTGHELGHLGLDQYLANHRDLIAGASMWIHLGANFAARYHPGVRLQYSDEAAKSLFASELAARKLAPATETKPGSRPYGEARNIFDGGGRYISILGRNGLFHHPDDVWPDAVDLPTTVQWVGALSDLSVKLAGDEG